jgi:hypothetical protein
MVGLSVLSTTSVPVVPVRTKGNLLISFRKGDPSRNGSIDNIDCFAGNRKIEPLPFSQALVEKIFPKGSLVLLPSEGGDDLPTGKISGYEDRRKDRSADRIGVRYLKLSRNDCQVRDGDDIEIKLSVEKNHPMRIDPAVRLYEIHVTNGLYTYMLLMPGPYYIRTQLGRKINLTSPS